MAKNKPAPPLHVVLPMDFAGMIHAMKARKGARPVIVRRKGPGHKWVEHSEALFNDDGPVGIIPVRGLYSFRKFKTVDVLGYTYAFAVIYGGK